MSKDTTTPSPTETLIAATVPNTLELNRPTLIGTYLKDDGNEARIRTRSGRLRRVVLGDRIGQAEITSIEMGRLELTLMGKTHALAMPGDAT